MNLFILSGLILATIATLLYVLLSYINQRTPQLNDAVVIFLGIGGVVSAVRIIGAVITGHFLSVAYENKDSIWSLVPDDSIQIVLGGVALAWVSAQTVIGSFRSVLTKKTGTHPSETAKAQLGQPANVSGVPAEPRNLAQKS